MMSLRESYYHVETKSTGQYSGGREAPKSRGKGTRSEAPPGGRQDGVVPGVATLDRSPDQPPVVRPMFPSHYELRGTRRSGPPGWSKVQMGPGRHTLEWIFFRTCLQGLYKPYCGVKCSQGLHFPATECGAWGERGHNPPTVEGE